MKKSATYLSYGFRSGKKKQPNTSLNLFSLLFTILFDRAVFCFRFQKSKFVLFIFFHKSFASKLIGSRNETFYIFYFCFCVNAPPNNFLPISSICIFCMIESDQIRHVERMMILYDALVEYRLLVRTAQLLYANYQNLFQEKKI